MLFFSYCPRQSYRFNYFSSFQSKIWSTFFFIEVTLWKIENNEDAICKVPLCLLHKLFRVKWAKKILYQKWNFMSGLSCDEQPHTISLKKIRSYHTQFFIYLDYLTNSKPKPRPLLPNITQKICFPKSITFNSVFQYF